MTQVIEFETATPRFALPLLLAGQSQKEFFVNEAHVLIDMLLHPAILGMASDPPSAPQEGDTWLVGQSATGDWAGHENSLATFAQGVWTFVAAKNGMRIYDLDLRQIRLFNTEWSEVAVPSEPIGGAAVDSEARQAISELVSALQAQGILPTP